MGFIIWLDNIKEKISKLEERFEETKLWSTEGQRDEKYGGNGKRFWEYNDKV